MLSVIIEVRFKGAKLLSNSATSTEVTVGVSFCPSKSGAKCIPFLVYVAESGKRGQH